MPDVAFCAPPSAALLARIMALSSPSRLEILRVLDGSARLPSQEEIAERVGLTKRGVCFSLKVLEEARLVKRRRIGRNVYFDIASRDVSRLLATLREAVRQEESECE